MAGFCASLRRVVSQCCSCKEPSEVLQFECETLLSEPPISVINMSKDKPCHYTNTEHCGVMYKKFAELREAGMFIDCVVSVQTVQIPAHRLVLAACSPYIEALLKFDNQTASSQDAAHGRLQKNNECLLPQKTIFIAQEKPCVIKLDDMDLQSVEMIVNYAYTGEIGITYDSVHDLLMCVDFLCINSISAACREFLRETLDMENCFPELQFAMSISDRELINHARRFLAQRFTDVSRSDDFLNSDVELVIEVLQDNELTILERVCHCAEEFTFFMDPQRQEEVIFKCIVRFVLHKIEPRYDLLPVLLEKGLRVGFLPDDITETFGLDNEIATSPGYTEVHRNALTLVRKMKSELLQSAERFSELWIIPRLTPGLKVKLSTEIARNTFQDVKVIPFDDSSLCPVGSVLYVTAMTLYSRRWDGRHIIGGIEVTYSNEQTVLHGSNGYHYPNISWNAGQSYEVDSFTLDPDERIIGATARSGWMIDGFCFTTNKRETLGPYGGPGGSESVLTIPGRSVYLAYLKGVVEHTQGCLGVRHLQLGWAYNSAIDLLPC